jgi:hypothetical protein
MPKMDASERKLRTEELLNLPQTVAVLIDHVAQMQGDVGEPRPGRRDCRPVCRRRPAARAGTASHAHDPDGNPTVLSGSASVTPFGFAGA